MICRLISGFIHAVAINTASLIGTNRPWIRRPLKCFDRPTSSTGSCLSLSINFASFREHILDAKRRKSEKYERRISPRLINYIEASETLTDLACENIFHGRTHACARFRHAKKSRMILWRSNSPQIRDNSEIPRDICHRQLTLELSTGLFLQLLNNKNKNILIYEINLHLYRDSVIYSLLLYNCYYIIITLYGTDILFENIENRN